MLGPKTWHREHCSMNLISPCLISAALAVFSGGLGKSSSLRAGGFGTSPPPSLKAMLQFSCRIIANPRHQAHLVVDEDERGVFRRERLVGAGLLGHDILLP
jgi:hypothetical protein